MHDRADRRSLLPRQGGVGFRQSHDAEAYAAKIGRRGFPLAYGAATTTAVGGGVLGLRLTAGFLWS